MDLPNQLPDPAFYYGLSCFLAISLISVFIWHGNRFIAMLDKMSSDITDLKIRRDLQQNKIDDHEQQLDDLHRKLFPVRYDRNGDGERMEGKNGR